MDKLTNSAKKRFFNADNDNIPNKEEINLEQQELKFIGNFKLTGLREINNTMG